MNELTPNLNNRYNQENDSNEERLDTGTNPLETPELNIETPELNNAQGFGTRRMQTPQS